MRYAIALVCLGAMVVGCAKDEPGETAAAPAIDSAVAGITGDSVRDTTAAPGDTTAATGTATVAISNGQGQALGNLTLRDSAGAVIADGTVTGLAPGNHGFHVHNVGRCDGPAFETAGPHWNPTSKQHGRQNPAGWHTGDMTNLAVTADGVAQVHETLAGASIAALLDADGAAIVVHADPDDNKTDPSGNSGARIACGVIQR